MIFYSFSPSTHLFISEFGHLTFFNTLPPNYPSEKQNL